MLLGYKIAAAGLLASLSLAGWLGYQKITLQTDYAVQALEVKTLKQNIATLESVNEQQEMTIDQLTALTEKQATLLVDYGEQNNDASRRATELEGQLNRLRQTESIKALEAPYERGNAASMRVGELLRNIAGNADSQSQDRPPSS